MHGARLGVDVGTARIGVARCDAQQLLTVPVATIAAGPHSVAEVTALAHECGATVVYVGLPVALSGNSTASTLMAQEWANEFSKHSGIPTYLVDERLTTSSAGAALRQAGKTTRDSRFIVDQVAASVLLEQALTIEKRSGGPAGVLAGGT
jgi:putative Holliday junction resolvase